MTPFPDSVVSVIRAAGYDLSAEPVPKTCYGRPLWRWTDSDTESPLWAVNIGDFRFRGVTGFGQEKSPRESLLAALANLVAKHETNQEKEESKARRLRTPYLIELHRCDAKKHKASADATRELVENVTAIWPDPKFQR